MTALHRAARLLGIIRPRHGCRRYGEPLAAWPLADPDIHRPELIPFTLDPHPYTETPR